MKNIKILLEVLIILFALIFFNTISNAAVQLDCEVIVDYVEELGYVIHVVSNENSQSSSVKISSLVNYLQQNEGITVTSIKDSKDNNCALTSDELVGTGFTITANNGKNYKAIVYGDTSGDGLINSTDINDIIRNFLGKYDDISTISKTAGDVKKDQLLNAADISPMINSFLGSMIGNILDTMPISNIEKSLSEVAKAGDYIDYPVQYTNVTTYDYNGYNHPRYGIPDDSGWRVAYTNNGTTKIVAAGCPERISFKLESSIDNYYHLRAKNYMLDSSNYTKYVNSTYATSAIGTLKQSEIDTYSINWLEKENSNGQQILIVIYDENFTASDGLKYYNDGVSAGSGIEVGTRPVVTLKNNLKVTGGDGTKANPWQISQ